ncbi:MAG: hypothetical protein J7M25_12275 [Deltaproteobacteria bacterium]|nr:hypothetical protein [Deltaproteobacteria bacterium]
MDRVIAEPVRRTVSRMVAVAPLLGFLLLAFAVMAVSAGCQDGTELNPCDPSRAVSVKVSHGQDSAQVDLGTLIGSRQGDYCLVPLPDVVDAAHLGMDVAGSFYDFVGQDGFQPTQVECALIDGDTLARGSVDMRTGTLVWDESLELRGCYSVTHAIGILVYDDENGGLGTNGN